MKYAVGIDVGGINTRVALLNENYDLLEREQFSTDEKFMNLPAPEIKKQKKSDKTIPVT